MIPTRISWGPVDQSIARHPVPPGRGFFLCPDGRRAYFFDWLRTSSCILIQNVIAKLTGRLVYTVQFADQGNEAANEAEAQLVLRRTLEDALGALSPEEGEQAEPEAAPAAVRT